MKPAARIVAYFLYCHAKDQPSVFHCYEALNPRTWLLIALSYREPEMAVLNYHVCYARVHKADIRFVVVEGLPPL